jgi:hypothetical protein
MIDRFRELRKSRTVGRTITGKPIPTYPVEFYVLWYRTNAVMRRIIDERDSQAEAPIAPEVSRELDRLLETFEEIAQI